MFIRLSRYLILGMIISLVTFLVAHNNKDKIKKETILLIGGVSAIIIFAISFRVEFYENVDSEEVEPSVEAEQEPIEEKTIEVESKVGNYTTDELRDIAVNIIKKYDVEGTEDDEELMARVEKELRAAIAGEDFDGKKEREEMAEKIVERVTNPKQEGELKVQTKPVENQLSMQYEKAVEEVIKEKIREQLYSDEMIKRTKKSDYVIMPVEEWSLPLEKRRYKCIPREEKEPCNCSLGGNFWGGEYMQMKGANPLPPAPKKQVEI